MEGEGRKKKDGERKKRCNSAFVILFLAKEYENNFFKKIKDRCKHFLFYFYNFLFLIILKNYNNFYFWAS